jgi:hypothetical protein
VGTMSEILTAISNFLSASWKAGAALFLLGGSVYLSKVYGVPPLSELDREWYQGAVLLGVLGLAFLIVHGLVLLTQGVGFIAPRFWRLILKPWEAKKKRELSLRNLETISKNELICLLWMKLRDKKRVKAKPGNADLNRLYEAHLLERDLSGRGIFRDIHWIVPDHIWSKLDEYEEDLKSLRSHPFSSPPWERSPYA